MDGLPDSDAEVPTSIVEALYRLTAETVRTVASLASVTPRRTLLWNQELDVSQFLGRTLLLADHVLYPDSVFDALLRRPSMRRLKNAAAHELQNADLLASGIAIPVPPGVAMAVQGKLALNGTESDLRNPTLVNWALRS